MIILKRLLLLATGLVFMLVGCSKPLPTDNIELNTVAFDATGKVVKASTLDPSKTVDIYIEPMCPHCALFEEDFVKHAQEVHDKGYAVKYNILSFLSDVTPDDYSNRAASHILAVAEKKPDLVKAYMAKIINPAFQPKGVKMPDDVFKEVFLSIGGTDDEWSQVKTVADNLYSNKVVANATTTTMNNTALKTKTHTGQVATPLVIVGDAKKAILFAKDVGLGEQVLAEIDKQKE